MAEPPVPHDIARRTFSVARRGYEQQEVRGFLHEVSAIIERLTREERELRERADRAEARLAVSDQPDEAMLLEVLGEETTRVLTSARDAAAEIRSKAEEAAARIIADATAEAAEIRANAVRDSDALMTETKAESEAILEAARTELERRKAEADEAVAGLLADGATAAQALRDEGQAELARAREEAEAAVAAAQQEGRVMVAEAQAVRERVLRDLAVRRKRARQQVEKLNAGRERLLEAYEVVRRTVGEATDELSTALTDARLAADAAARRIDDEPEPTLEQLDEEVANAGLVDLPIAEIEPDDSPGPFSGEVPAVEPDTVPVENEPAATPEASLEPPVPIEDRRSRKRKKRGGGFEGLPPGELTIVQPTSDDEQVRILAEPAAAPEPEPASEPEPESEPETAAAAEAEVGEEVDDAVAVDGAESAPVEVEAQVEPGEVEGEAAADEAPASPADDVFARLRAEQQTAEAEEDTAPAAADESTEEPAAPPPADAVSRTFAARRAALADVDKELGRRLKRGLADEQNEVLDLLRRAKPAGVSDVLPEPDEHAARWAEAVADSLADAAAAGADWSGGKASSVADLADELARSLTEPLRERIDRSFAASDGNLDDVADRVRALYREWKGKRLTETSAHYASAAYARGVFDGVPVGSQVRWVVDPSAGPCPDCDDNVLAGNLMKGSAFPTGNPCAPAHPGCHCLVLAADT